MSTADKITSLLSDKGLFPLKSATEINIFQQFFRVGPRLDSNFQLLSHLYEELNFMLTGDIMKSNNRIAASTYWKFRYKRVHNNVDKDTNILV